MSEAKEPRIPGRGDDLEAAIAAPDDQTDPATLPAMQIQEAAAKRHHDRPADDSAAEEGGSESDLATAWHTGDKSAEQDSPAR